ncbi:MAG: hypothetical protein CL893_04365 [Dehalococcoidia bacterium]|nr:hypothetical protein [Dehalococcoidia bacterium]|tara:strand:- start:5222 stop:5413 length:192 start_codon:yes stop_codon:yes gene_type:complete
MKKDLTTKEYFKKLLEDKNIKLSDEDFEQSYLSYRNFRESYSNLLNEDFSEFEPRQRIFDVNE